MDWAIDEEPKLGFFESWQHCQNSYVVPAILFSFIIGAIWAYFTIHVGCYLIGLIIFEVIVIGLTWRVWSLLTRLLIVLFSLLGYIFGRWLCRLPICPT